MKIKKHQQERKLRLAQALRENLRKRKEQMRLRKDPLPSQNNAPESSQAN